MRDYVHVSDLADAHVRALEVIARGSPPLCLNLGGGMIQFVRNAARVGGNGTIKRPQKLHEVAGNSAETVQADATSEEAQAWIGHAG